MPQNKRMPSGASKVGTADFWRQGERLILPEFVTKLLVLSAAILVVGAAFFCPLLARTPGKCPACGKRKLVASHKKPGGKIITTSYEGGGHEGSGASTSYDVTFKCKACGEEITEHVAG